MWYVYCLLCENDSIYAGITSDLQRRFTEHLSGDGARYTRAFPPEKVMRAWICPDRSIASKVEYSIKNLPTEQKHKLCRSQQVSEMPAELDALRCNMQPVPDDELPKTQNTDDTQGDSN